jgi:polyketide biosynthesis 3-hydroxy-3-methylglutaryl-CoA synthase-like enzyme PksG
MTAPAVGIEALNVYAGLAQISVEELFAGRGLDPVRLKNLMMTEKSVGLPCEDPVTNAVNAARPILDRLSAADRERIEVLVTSTESGVDLSKSVASYVHEYLGLSRRCRLLEVKQACYGATGALQLAAGYLASGLSPGAKILVIATDVSLVDDKSGYTEPAMGFGAAALLLGTEPRVLTLDVGAFGIYGYETMDSARPAPTFDVAEADRSLFTYLDCLDNCFRAYCDRVDGADFRRTFDYLAFHTPFAGLVRAAHRKMMRDHARGADVDADFEQRVSPALRYPSRIGNLCSGSVYASLASVIDHAEVDDGARIGLYSYGSGCSSEFFSGTVDASAREAVREMRISQRLDGRVPLRFEEYTRLLEGNRNCLVPEQNRTIDLEPYLPLYAQADQADQALLLWTGTKDYHRTYDWISPSGGTDDV